KSLYVAKRKYLALFLCLLLYPCKSLSSGLVPDKGRYKIIFDTTIIDSPSRHRRDVRQSYYPALSAEIIKHEDEIKTTSRNSPRWIELHRKIIHLNKELIRLAESYQDNYGSSVSFEAGLGF